MLNLVNLVYGQTIKDNEERPRKQRHYPSSACAIVGDDTFVGKCRRSTWYEWKGAQRTDPMDAPALFKVNTGNLIHEQLDSVLNRALADLGYSEEAFKPGIEGVGDEVAILWQAPGLKYPVSGRMDKRLIGPDGLRLGVEWKSTYGRSTDYIKRDGPKEDNLLQCAAYLEQDVFELDAIALIYAARDSGYIFGYWVTQHKNGLMIETMGSTKTMISPLGWPALKRGFQSVESCLSSDIAPPRDYASNEWRCEYCGHKSLCWGLS